MYEELLRMMTPTQTSGIQNRIERAAQLRSLGHYANWFRVFLFIVGLVLGGYAAAWHFEPNIGVHGWLNDHWQYASLLLSVWGTVGAMVLIHYAFLPDLIPLPVYFAAIIPLVFYGFATVFSGVAFVAVVAHPSVAMLAFISALFYAATLRQFAREAIATANLKRHTLELQSKILTIESASVQEELKDVS